MYVKINAAEEENASIHSAIANLRIGASVVPAQSLTSTKTTPSPIL